MSALNTITLECDGTIEGEGMDCEESVRSTADSLTPYGQRTRWARQLARQLGWSTRPVLDYPGMADGETVVDLCPKHLLAYDAPTGKTGLDRV